MGELGFFMLATIIYLWYVVIVSRDGFFHIVIIVV